jgi:hypothetical protein
MSVKSNSNTMQWNPSLQNPQGLTMMKALPFSFIVSSKCKGSLGLRIILAPIFIFSTWNQMLSISICCCLM